MNTKNQVKATLFIMLIMALLIVSCGPTPATETQEPLIATEEPLAPTQVPVVERPDIIIAMAYLNETHDPTNTYNIEIPVLMNIYDNLIFKDFGEEGNGSAPIPGLAES